jgi:hypothetical protein
MNISNMEEENGSLIHDKEAKGKILMLVMWR